jgi:hypothetical protein
MITILQIIDLTILTETEIEKGKYFENLAEKNLEINLSCFNFDQPFSQKQSKQHLFLNCHYKE